MSKGQNPATQKCPGLFCVVLVANAYHKCILFFYFRNKYRCETPGHVPQQHLGAYISSGPPGSPKPRPKGKCFAPFHNRIPSGNPYWKCLLLLLIGAISPSWKIRLCASRTVTPKLRDRAPTTQNCDPQAGIEHR